MPLWALCPVTAASRLSPDRAPGPRSVHRAAGPSDGTVCWPRVYPSRVPLKNILVVDDDPDIRRIATLSLERVGGFRVALAASAEDALAQAALQLPDLVLLDVSMPGTDGPATLALLRAQPATERVPVIFFTATASADEVQRLCALGAAGVISKPFDLMALPARVRDIFSVAGLQ